MQVAFSERYINELNSFTGVARQKIEQYFHYEPDSLLPLWIDEQAIYYYPNQLALVTETVSESGVSCPQRMVVHPQTIIDYIATLSMEQLGIEVSTEAYDETVRFTLVKLLLTQHAGNCKPTDYEAIMTLIAESRT